MTPARDAARGPARPVSRDHGGGDDDAVVDDWVRQVLKQCHPDMGIRSKAVRETVDTLTLLMHRLRDANPDDLRTALREVMPSELAKHAELEMDKATHWRRPVFELKGAPSMSAVLEYICAELMELGGNVARDAKKTRVSWKHIAEAMSHDTELDALWFNLCAPNTRTV